MTISLSHTRKELEGDLKITGSKSESNRLLILQALFPEIEIENLSNSDDSKVMQMALEKHSGTIDIHHAGTAMRFLTAYFASRENNEVVLTGSKRMKERPIRLLVEALREMGADIEYMKDDGFPPLKINGKKLGAKSVKLQANVSSQYVSALMLIAPSLPNGLEIILHGKITSTPYILMTLEIMKHAGIEGKLEGNCVKIEPVKELTSKSIAVESDWSSASYFYSLAAISDRAEIRLSNYRETSRQGDCCLSSIYRNFGVETTFEKNSIVLKKGHKKRAKRLSEDLANSPDIAQTIAVTCLALNMECNLTGLHTLKIKETDRLQALKTEIEKFGAKVAITSDSLRLFPVGKLNENVRIATYNDHRMAMAFAPLALRVPLEIEDAGVVSKSYPDFWKDFSKLGIESSEIE
ncbi:3-phosphoshikimate 1-carboxyvinyltransferase [Christiangramia fulva]|uniref:3-phosphoshikimate 1-carboxyvinyltransferase n=1 Tax=Christiangramia fulva TaxID=2126553 RepID=A0A2R3Z5E8_9FLAO|nr:3-phosphoshikimate 1-carboxyvinyltransferase [Christiangramia fulva]AVR45506.1 3-phosphoshikimate 1-carboxyvinyltransferase [Christiangramia fulva]